MANKELEQMLDELRLPFHPSRISWKPGATKGERALALAYADLRVYMERLDEVCGSDWSVAYEPWGEDRIICRLTIMDVTRSSTGEMAAQDEKNEMGGTVAEAQAFKRASAMFGLGRYLYTLPSGWEEIDPGTKRFTDKTKAKLNGMLMQHYRRATEKSGKPGSDEPVAQDDEEPEAKGTPPHNRMWGIGSSLFGNDWDSGARRWILRTWSRRNTPDTVRESSSLFADDEKTLIGDWLNEKGNELQRIWREHKEAKEKATA